MATQQREVTIAVALVMLAAYVQRNKAVMLWGSPGIGKTSIVCQYAESLKWKVIDFRANIREPVDVRGIPVVNEKDQTTKWYSPDELPRVERDGEKGILFIDEINTAAPQMMAVLMQLVLERKVGDYHLPPGWIVVAAGNHVSDRAAAQRMPTALANRFAHIYVKADVDAACAYWQKIGVAPEMIAFIRYRRELIHVMPKNPDEHAFPTPRSLVSAAEFVNEHQDIREKLLAGVIGDAYASEFEAFIGLYRSIGSLEHIVKDPDNAPLSGEKDPSIRYATCVGLSRIATRQNFGNIIRYAKRLPREFEVLIVKDATSRDEGLKNVAAYGAWACENQDIILQAA